MAGSDQENLLQRLAQGTAGGASDWDALAATEPEQPEEEAKDEKLDRLFDRINNLAGIPATEPDPDEVAPPPAESPGKQAAPGLSLTAGELIAQEPASGQPETPGDAFFPEEPATFRKAGVTDTEVEALILKYLLARGDAAGRGIADEVKLTFTPVNDLLHQMKSDQLVVHRGAAPMNDYQYQLTDVGRERARRYSEQCSYFGSAPVSLEDYIASVTAQSLAGQHPTPDDLKRAFADLLISPEMFDRLGPAINSGRGLFLFGPPGNGKTSIAERVTIAFGQHIWIPRTIGVDGEIIRLFDPINHEETPPAEDDGLLDQRKIDKRWVRIRRPTIVAGGELTMSSLEVTIDRTTGISEAPLQLKANCGTFVIDDFGRQRMSVDDLLNRWIVPLEKRYDFLNLASGKKISVPFDELLIFSTNLEPRDLVDEAFLRRIPYKIEAVDPTEEEFRELFVMMSKLLGFEHRTEPIDYLIENHYRAVNRPFRCCQPRDLLLQIRNYCAYKKLPMELTNDFLDFAVENYFAVM